ncbi:RNase II stability modulator [compost metagenome]
MLYGVSRLAVTISIGAALYPQHAEQFAGLYKAADEALYKAKQQGRSGFVMQGGESTLNQQECLQLDVLQVPSGLR